jgi:hypothetical protein
VRILGGAEAAVERIGATPPNWTVLPFGSVHPSRFLADIDYFVYFHHPDWVEAFGRNVIEAMASGAPVILPRHFEPLLGDAALYGEPRDVREIVVGLHADPMRYRERAEQGRAFVTERFGSGVHVRRLQALIGEPSGRPRVSPPALPRRRRVLMLSTDSHGVEAVVRLVRLARPLASDHDPVFAVSAPCTQLVTELGHLCERLDATATGKRGGRRWIARRLRAIVERERAEVVVVAGETVPPGVEKAARELDVPFVWLAPPGVERVPEITETVALDDPFLPVREDVAVPHEGPRLALVALGADARTLETQRVLLAARAVREAGGHPVLEAPAIGTLGPELDDQTTVRLDPLGRGLHEFGLAVVAPDSHLAADLAAVGVPYVEMANGDGSGLVRKLRAATERGARTPAAAADGTEAAADVVRRNGRRG